MEKERDMSQQWSFSKALEFLKEGKKVAREGWNGKGMYIYLADLTALRQLSEGGASDVYNDTIAMWTADKKVQLGWLASQTDMFAEDWIIVE